jgi:hypothetical protein
MATTQLFFHHPTYPVIDSSLCQQLFVAYGMLVDAVLWLVEGFS